MSPEEKVNKLLIANQLLRARIMSLENDFERCQYGELIKDGEYWRRVANHLKRHMITADFDDIMSSFDSEGDFNVY